MLLQVPKLGDTLIMVGNEKAICKAIAYYDDNRTRIMLLREGADKSYWVSFPHTTIKDIE